MKNENTFIKAKKKSVILQFKEKTKCEKQGCSSSIDLMGEGRVFW